ncbi:peroxiredoxin family protein [Niabella drilacis]|uniref:Peroxiredoxin n=1 Tax=Niabella drilacis (strain DSM 25811 / CCM 8410 / CCUG 62505 / LMG 26954 / E90) TaxID=1285928 RepID=A0A1G6L6T8_NIADE|nr:TlpA disulfide reductase family protein [Niabella drilacis]SDC38833.1 Peroxiredoxin [Niabella drilacis]
MTKWRLTLLVYMIAAGGATAQTVVTPAAAPPFSLPDQNGTPVSLEKYRKSMVLVQFWASWCLPCRIENRRLVKQYPRFNDLPFEILSISVDVDRAQWKNAIAADKMAWPQLLDDTNKAGCAACRWGAGTLPASFLIDPEGRIIAVDAASLLTGDPRGFRKLLQKRLAPGSR